MLVSMIVVVVSGRTSFAPRIAGRARAVPCPGDFL
jgi:hypothetical protein